MNTKNLTLFGKHPAWSDHMFVTFDAEIGRYLKHVFYDHSVIPALQGGDGDQRIPETWNFLVSVRSQIFFMVSVPSRDSVGRSRFPLVAAYPLPFDLQLEAASDQLNTLAHELRELLRDMLDDSSGEDLNQWQAEVEQKAKNFKSKVDWSSIDSTGISGILSQEKLASLMTRLLDEHNALSLKSCSFIEAMGLFLVGVKQFKSSVPSLLVLDQENKAHALFFASTESTTFNLKRSLSGNLPPLSVSAGNVLPKVTRLLKSAVASQDEMFSVNDVPSLKLDENRKPSSRKPFFLAILFALIASILIGFFLGRTEDDATDSAQMDSFLKRWSSNAISYIEWVQPLGNYVTEQSIKTNDFEPVLENLKLDLNPFSAVGVNVPSMKLAKNPSDQVLKADSTEDLETVFANINQLKASLINYYEQRFTDPFPAELKQTGYSLPKFVELDFSQSPQPEFGLQLVQQFDACTRSHATLTDLGAAIVELERLVIDPLYELYPKHAQIIRDYVQTLVKNSTSLKQFQDQYELLLKRVGYPEFVELDSLNSEALSVDAEWVELPQQAPSLQSIDKLMECLEIYRKSEASTQTIDLNKQAFELPVQQPILELDEMPDVLLNELKQFNDQRLVSEIQNHLEALQSSATKLSNVVDIAEITQLHEQQVDQLFSAFRFLDTAFMHKISNLHQAYLEHENAEKHLSDFVFSKYQSLSPELGNIESVNQAIEAISLDLDAHLVALNSKLNELEIDYISNQTSASDVAQLHQQISELKENPLYFEGVLGYQLSIPEATDSENATALKTMSALLRDIKMLAAEKKVDAQELALVTAAFNGLNQSEVTSELKDSIRLAFDQYLQQLRSANAEEDILLIYANLENYLPKSIQTSQDTAYVQIAEYWNDNSSTAVPKLTEKNDLEKRITSTESPIVRKFFEQLLEMSEKNKPQLTQFMQGKTDASGQDIYRIYIDEDRSHMEITFTENDLKLVFLSLKTETGEVFVQQTPLSLKQFILLSNLCGMDTEYSLALQDSLWPRCFEVGMGQSFRVLNQWQFRNGNVFNSLEPFSKKTLPAHLNEPKEILRLAECLGLRLLKPDECVDFVSLADRSPHTKLQISTEDQENIQKFNTVEYSIYADSITASIEQETWMGGIDFERGVPDENQFGDVLGGVSELAYDGTDFYAFGGSWLYAPFDPAKCFRIAKSNKMYIDLGVRFVAEISAVSDSYSDLVHKLALQFLTSEN